VALESGALDGLAGSDHLPRNERTVRRSEAALRIGGSASAVKRRMSVNHDVSVCEPAQPEQRTGKGATMGRARKKPPAGAGGWS